MNMNSLRKTVGFLMVLMLAVFALPSTAASPQKIFYAVFPTFITSSPVTITFYNATPNGNSTINSLSIGVVTGANVTINCAGNSLGTGTPQADGSCVITNFAGIPAGGNRTFTLSLNIPSGACANATWVVAANTGNAFPQGTAFAPVTSQMQLNSSCDGALACATESTPGPTSFSDGTVTGIRYPNKDGSACVAIGYDFTDLIVTNNNTIHQVWDTNSQPNAMFTYAIPWLPVWADPLTGLPNPTQVAWALNSSNLPDYKDARFCLSQTLPVPSVGTLGAAITTPTQTPITVTSSITTFTQKFPIVIDQERMTVAGISGNQWAVTRGAGGTTKTAHSQFYSDNVTAKKVMSTLLPLDGDGVTGNLMHMCILTQEVNIVAPASCTAAAPTNPPPACLQINQTLLDAGDGFANQE